MRVWHFSLMSSSAPRQDQDPLWLYRRHVAEFSDLGSTENDAIFSRLSRQVTQFECLPGCGRLGDGVTLPLNTPFMRLVLHGSVQAEHSSASRGERQAHLETRFALSRGWELKLRQSAKQELVNGRVRLRTELWFKPGHALSFRWVILARAMRWALERDIHGKCAERRHGQ